MKHFFFPVVILLLIAFNNSYGQDIYTFAGIYAPFSGGFSGDGGQAPLAHLNYPEGIATDRFGNVYFADLNNNRIRKVNTAGIITTVAGKAGYEGYSGDGGLADSAQLSAPVNVALDTAGNLYIADQGNNRIRRVDGITGIITTIAGNNIQGYSGDGGPATAAELYWPAAIAIDKATGNIYIADTWNNVIRMISSSGIITTVAGVNPASAGYGGDGGPATAAFLYRPEGLAFDTAGNLYISDTYNYVVRKVNTGGIITTFAGTHNVSGDSGDGGAATLATFLSPVGIATDTAGNVFIADGSNRVRMVNAAGIVSTFAGNGVSGYIGDGASATAAEISSVGHITIDAAHNIYITDDGNNNIRRIGAAVAGITIVCNTGDTACYNTLINFTATAIADTFAPHYQWVKNGVYTGTDSAIYTPVIFATGDHIKCLLYNIEGDTLASSTTIIVDSLPSIGSLVCPSVFCLGSAAQVYENFSMFSPIFYSLQYFSTDSNIISISSFGYYGVLATAKSLGADTVYYTAINECGIDSTHQVVSVVPNNLSPITGPDSVCAGAYVTYSDTSAGGIWSLFYPDAGFYSINSGTGLFYASLYYSGPFIITYGTYGCTVRDTPYIENITQYILGPHAVYAYSTILLVDSISGGTWSSGNDAVASIDPVTGVLLGVSPGVDTVYYTVTLSAGCTLSISTLVHVLAFSGVASVTNGASFTIFPNPASGQLNLSWIPRNEDKGLINITDIAGKKVMAAPINMQNASTATLDISKLTPGIYMLSLQTDSGYYYSKLEVQ